MKLINAQSLKPMLTAGEEVAFLDVRELGQYGEGHPFFCIPFPFSRLESLATTLLPCKHTPLVLLDDNDGVAERAAAILESLGYGFVSVLQDGANGWSAAGYTHYKGVNVVSKTYGELLEHVADTPRLTATELQALRQRDDSIVVLDGRSPEEFRKMSLPGALCCPNAELGYRLSELVPNDETTVVINCAGRTRSILGVEGLRIINTPNPVYALENGTQGWKLAGLDLDHGVAPQSLPEPDDERRATLAAQARHLIAESGLVSVSPDTLSDWIADERRTTYLLDVRTKAEYDKAHWPGARHAPGGQLVQATDQYVAVRYARIVLSDNNRLRAATTAIRLRDMGHDVYLLDADASEGISRPAPVAASENDSAGERPLPTVDSVRGVTILDASPGMQFREAHIDGAQWITRARLNRLDVTADQPLLVTGTDDELIAGVVSDLRAQGFSSVSAVCGSPESWRRAGHRTVSTPNDPSDEHCIDYLFFVHDRHDGNLDAARRYLEWETGLVAQLDEQERGSLSPQARFDNETTG